MKRCGACNALNTFDAPFCIACRARLGQERERAALCRGCLTAETWRRDGYCDECSAHQDEIGNALGMADDITEEDRDSFCAWMDEHRDTVQAVELG